LKSCGGKEISNTIIAENKILWGSGGDNKKTYLIDNLNIQLTILNNLDYLIKNN